MEPLSFETFRRTIRQMQACNCLDLVLQNVADCEDSNTPKILILVLDAFGYSAEEIQCRKQLLSFCDIFNKIFSVNTDACEYNLTGSASQGLTNSLYQVTYQTDFDYVIINKTIKVISNEEYLKYKENPHLFNDNNGSKLVLRVEDDSEFPGYAKLLYVLPFLTAVGIVFSSKKQYFSSKEYRLGNQSTSYKPVEEVWKGTNGPAHTTHWYYPQPSSNIKIKTDFVRCLKFKTLTATVHKWADRPRPYDWPSKELIQKIRQEGCYLAPVGHLDSEMQDLQWRLSFCGEKFLFAELKPVQFYCFVALRLILKEDICRLNEDVLSSFHMKNVVYWCAERSSCEWTISNFENCLKTCIKTLTKFLSSKKFPNYFVVGRNMFNSKLTSELSSKILKCLQKYNDNIYEILSLDSLILLRFSTLYKRSALELAVQKSVIHACIVVYSQIISQVLPFHFNIWNVSASKNILDHLHKAYHIHNILESQEHHYFRRHILRSYIHSMLGFLNYACFKTFMQNEYLSDARKHLVESMTFSNIPLMCRAATFFFMELEFEYCLKICNSFLNNPVPPQYLHEQVYEGSNKVQQVSFDLIGQSDITLLYARKKQLMSIFSGTEVPSCCEISQCKTDVWSVFENLTYMIMKDTYFHVVYTHVELKALPEVIQYELYSLSKSSLESKEDIHGIYISPFLICCLLAFSCHHEKGHNESMREEILTKIDEYFIECKNRTSVDFIKPGIILQHEPLYQIANIAAYCHLKAKHYRKAAKLILESMSHFPSRRNVAYGYVKCVTQCLLCI